MATVYKNFETAIKADFDIKIKMNQIFKGYVAMENINAIKMTRGRSNTYVKNQGFEYRKTKNGNKVWTYWLEPTEAYDTDGHDRPYAIYETINNGTAEVFCQGIFKYAKTDKKGRHIFVRIKK